MIFSLKIGDSLIIGRRDCRVSGEYLGFLEPRAGTEQIALLAVCRYLEKSRTTNNNNDISSLVAANRLKTLRIFVSLVVSDVLNHRLDSCSAAAAQMNLQQLTGTCSSSQETAAAHRNLQQLTGGCSSSQEQLT